MANVHQKLYKKLLYGKYFEIYVNTRIFRSVFNQLDPRILKCTQAKRWISDKYIRLWSGQLFFEEEVCEISYAEFTISRVGKIIVSESLAPLRKYIDLLSPKIQDIDLKQPKKTTDYFHSPL